MSRELYRLVESGELASPEKAPDGQLIYCLANPALRLDLQIDDFEKRRVVSTNKLRHHQVDFISWLQGKAKDSGSARVTTDIEPGHRDEKTMLAFKLDDRKFVFTQRTIISKNRLTMRRLKRASENYKVESWLRFEEIDSPVNLPLFLNLEQTRNSLLKARDNRYYEYRDPFLGIEAEAYNKLLEMETFKNYKKLLRVDRPSTLALLAEEKKDRPEYTKFENGIVVRYSPYAKIVGAPSALIASTNV